jgi:outer membrane cobalamin receptor
MPRVRGKLGGAVAAVAFLLIAPLFAESVRGTVIDYSGNAITEAVVRVAGYVDITDASGGFHFDNVPPGQYELTITHISYESKHQKIEVKSGIERNQIIRLTSAVFTSDEISVSIERNSSAIVVNNKVTSREVTEMVKNLPGTILIESGTETSVSIRGSHPRDVLVVIDGTPIGRNENGVCDLNTIPSANIEWVQLITDNIPAEYASIAPAGVILIKTARRQSANINLSTGIASFGTHDLNISGNYMPVEGLNFELFGSYSYSDRDFEYSAGDSTSSRMNNSEKASSFGFSGEYQRSNLLLNGGFSAAFRDDGMPGDLNHPTPEAYKLGDYYRGNLSAELHHRKLIFRSRISAYNSTNYYFSPRPFVYSPVDADHLVRGTLANTSLGYAFSIALPRIGVEYAIEEYSAVNNLNESRNIGPVSRNMSSVWTEAPVSAKLLDILTVEITPSLRWDSCDEGDFALRKSLFLGLSIAKAGFVGGMSGSYSEAFRLATFSDLYWQRDAFAEGNSNLAPEESQKKNIRLHCGYKAQWLDIYSSMDFFAREIDSVIVWRRGFDGIYRPYNSGGEETIGREDYIAIGLFNTLSLSWSNTSIQAIHRSPNPQLDGKWLPFRPEYIHRLSGEITLFHFSLQIDCNAVGKRYLLEANTKWTEPYSTIDMALSYNLDLHRQFDLAIKTGIRNITDEDYEVMSGYPMPGRSFYLKIDTKLKLKETR